MKAALYLRSSKDRSDVSIDAQRRELLELAKSKSLLVVEEFADVVESGKDENRPGFQALMHTINQKQRHWDHLLALDTSRIARNSYLAQGVHHECEKRAIKIIYAKMPETGSVMDVVMRQVFQAFDQLHSIMSKEKGLSGMAENVKQGYRAGGRAPIGYKLQVIDTGAMRDGEAVTKSKLMLDSNSGHVGKYFKLRAAGITRPYALKQVDLGNIAATSLVGMEWNALTYAGHTVWNVHNERLSSGGYRGGTKRRPRSEWIIQHDTHPALITTEEAEYLINKLETSARSQSRRTDGEYLLSGLMFNSSGMPWHGCDGRYYRVGKGKRIKQEEIEQAIITRIAAELRSQDFVTSLSRHSRKKNARLPDSSIKPMRDNVSAITGKIARLAEIASEAESARPWLEQIDKLEKQRDVLVAELEQAEAYDKSARLLLAISDAEVGNILSDLADKLEKASPETIKQVLTSIIDKITLDESPRLYCEVHYSIKSGDSVASPRGFEPRSPP